MIVPEARLGVDAEAIRDFCERWKIRRFSLFGSVLRDDFRPDSDVDVLVSFRDDENWSLWDLGTLADELQVLLGRDVDLVEERGLHNPFKRHEILKTRRVVYDERNG
jgi:hypothetical protein